MKIKLAVLGSLAILGAGLWYLFKNYKLYQEEMQEEPVGPIQGHLIPRKLTQHPIREISHSIKEIAL